MVFTPVLRTGAWPVVSSPRMVVDAPARAPATPVEPAPATASATAADPPATTPPSSQAVELAEASEPPRLPTAPPTSEPVALTRPSARPPAVTPPVWQPVRDVPELLPVPLTELPCALPTQTGVPVSAWSGDTAVPTFEAVPSAALPYRGVMTTSNGTPRVGRINTIFALYHAADGGVPVWVDIKAVETSATGEYVVWLGQPTPFPPDLFTSGSPPWLGVQPEGSVEAVRVRITDRPCRRAAPDDPPATRASTTPPTLIPYRSVLYDSTGAPLVGRVSTIFAFYEEADGGIPMWVDIQTLRTGAAGGYTVLLGSGTELPTDLLTSGASRWLGVQPDGHAEQQRVEFVATSGPLP